MLRVIIPLVIGHLVTRKCKPAEETEIANSIRELMWPVLLVAVGFSWNLTHLAAPKGAKLKIDAFYGVATGLMALWLHLQLCASKVDQANVILMLVAAATFALVYISGAYTPLAAVTLSVVLLWLLVAERIKMPKIKLPKFALPKITISQDSTVENTQK